jgi:GTP-binding protein EngB required for normal cell division
MNNIKATPFQSESDGAFVGLDKLLSPDQNAVLQIIEDLRHIDKYDIDLPRIIVCGDQSSGKSSVLDAISRLDFPRDESTCTTFATELTLDHHDGAAVAISIIWNNTKQEEEEFHPKDLSLKSLASTINEAKGLMESRNGQTGCTFFKDVLRIKASNPGWPPLTLVDLPGLVQSGMDDQELETVVDIISTHMVKPKTIILAVVSASHDAQNQGIMKLAQKYDPEGRRTMGIITKPDRVSSPQMEQKWIQMAMGKDSKYKCELGWHVVRNRDPAETNCDFDQRDRKEEEFFRDSAWKRNLRGDQLGIDSLRVKLSKLLEDHTRSALPGIMRELDRKLKACQYNLKGLGPSRTTPEDQQIYLTRIAQSFYDVTKDAVNAQYEGEFFEKGTERNLFARIKSQNNDFVDLMYSWGHTYEDAEFSTTQDFKRPNMANSLKHLGPPKIISHADFISKIHQIQAKRGGHEFDGMFNPMHFKDLFHEQSHRWRDIAQAHLDNVWKETRTFLLTAVRHAAGPSNEHTATVLILYVVEPAIKMKRKALFTKLEELMRPYETFPVMAHDPEFIHEREILYEKLHDKTKTKIAKHLGADTDDSMMRFAGERMSTYGMTQSEYPSDSSQILELMKMYYKVSIFYFSPGRAS